MNEALKMVKNEFGPEAVILSARKIENDKGLFGLSKSKGIEITAAMDIQGPEKKETDYRSLISRYSGNQSVPSHMQSINKKPKFINALRKSAVNYSRRLNTTEQGSPYANTTKRQLYSAYHQMLDQDVDDKIAVKIVQKINKYTLSEGYFPDQALNSYVVRVLTEKGIRAGRVKLENGSRKIVALVGPTGVGKTSTIAKLSAAATTRAKKQRVALITLDQERIGAIEQIKVYAKILGTPLRAVSSGKELMKCVTQLSECDLIFIDTPGIQLKNQQHMAEIKEVFDRVSEIESHLVMSAATNEKTLRSTLENYEIFNISRLIFTKLDECSTFGSVLNQLHRTKIPASYFTNGPQIPEDIEAASLEKLIDLMFNEKTIHSHLKGSPEYLAQNMMQFEKILYGHEMVMDNRALHRGKKAPFAASM